MKASIGRIVIYRSRTGSYDVPAMVTATEETLNPAGVKVFEESGGSRGVPPLDPGCVHLTVFTPGRPGLRGSADDFEVEPEYGVSENVAGCYQEWNIPECVLPPADKIVAGERAEPAAGSWRWPERVS